MTKLEWHTEKRKVKDLIAYKDNPRFMRDSQNKQLIKSIKTFNIVEAPAIDLDGTLIAGNQRVRILMRLGRGNEEIDVRLPNRKLTKEEFEKYNLISNRLTGEWNLDLLKNIEIETLLESGFDDSDFSQIFDNNLEVEDDNFNADKEASKIKEPKTKLNDFVLLGQNRLICGDSRNPEVVKRLVGNQKVNMINFDPIYNIKLNYDKGIGTKGKYGGRVTDRMTDEEYRVFLKTIFQNGLAHTGDDCHVFSFCDQSYIWLIQDLYKELGISNKRVCLWIKNNTNITPQIAFNKCFEPCVYGTKGSPYLSPIHNLNEIINKEVGTGNRLTDDILDLFDIWLVKRMAAQDYEHPTQKPPSLYEKAFRRCSKPGDIILDLFGGSGSQLIAAEQLKRRMFLSEIDPVFCDVIIARYKLLTGKEPKYVSS